MSCSYFLLSGSKYRVQVGSAAISVDIQANPAVVETTSATLNTVMPEREIKDLPLNGRNFTQLLTLSAGVASTEFGEPLWKMSQP